MPFRRCSKTHADLGMTSRDGGAVTLTRPAQSRNVREDTGLSRQVVVPTSKITKKKKEKKKLKKVALSYDNRRGPETVLPHHSSRFVRLIANPEIFSSSNNGDRRLLHVVVIAYDRSV